MPSQKERVEILKDELKKRILVLDGAMGTAIQQKNLNAADFGGSDLEGCNENLTLTRPSIIQDIHESYLNAGCDIVETNTFGATPFVLDEYGLGSKAYEINRSAAEIARKAAHKFSKNNKLKFVAGSIGPTTKAISVTGGISFDDLVSNFKTQAKGLLDGGVDYFLLETCQDTRNIKAGLFGIDQAMQEAGVKIPIAVSGTIEPMGTMLAGQSIDALYASLMHRDLLYIGLNCATGPEFMTDHIRTLSKYSHFNTSCVPNAGLPDIHGHYLETPKMLATVVERFLSNQWLNVIGGCCGTTEQHIHVLSNLATHYKPRIATTESRSILSGIDPLEITNEIRPVIVGERTNVIGSRKFKRLICEEKFEEAADIARAQVKNGAQIIDVCLANPDRDEMKDIAKFMECVIRVTRTPLMIDSTDEMVIDLALKYSQGKAIINSINLEDGEERFEKVVPIAKKYGAALVVGTIDDDPEQGMAVSRKRKLEVAKRSFDLLIKKYGFNETDIYWDPLVFPCATGDQNYIGSALETIEGIKEIKKIFPNTKTVLGISNVSFGLPEAGREVLNSVFLYHCVQAGLDLAIVNSEKLVRYSSISEIEKNLSENLLFNKTDGGRDPIAEFAAHFRQTVVKPKVDRKSISLDQRLSNAILEGSREGLIDDLNEALKKYKPLEVINGPLMKGMDEVGKLFNENKLIVAEVLQSAEIMKLAVNHLEHYMEKTESASRGKILLATVKGDVHDIGKNLVDIILSNNGFKVINLGIKIPPEQLILAIREHNPDIVGLSGLLVKSAQQMVSTVEDFEKSGIKTKVLVGGAALSSLFVDRFISKAYPLGFVSYAPDAMSGLELAKIIVDEDKFNQLKNTTDQRRKELEFKQIENSGNYDLRFNETRSINIPFCEILPNPQDFERRVIKSTSLDQIWSYINPLMLYARHLGIKGGIARKLEASQNDKLLRKELEETEPKSVQIWDQVQIVKKEIRGTDIMKPIAVYQYFKAASQGNQIHIYSKNTTDFKNHKPLSTFTFPRQKKENGLCLSDYVNPLEKTTADIFDSICLFVTSAGSSVREYAQKLKEQGEYLKSHIISALAIESAEGYAELLHSQIRNGWGFPDPIDMTMMQRFQAKYHGKRYSFGYPACPSLDDQKILFDLISPQDIGVQLTDGFMMDPEASVSAIVFHHPDAQYFSVGSTGSGIENENR